MSDLTKAWKDALVPESPPKPTTADMRRAADAIVAGIPARIAEATKQKKGWIDLTNGWVTFDDVAGDRKDKVDELSDRLCREKRPLKPSDLAGSFRMVVEWCERNGLECFLRAEKIPLNDFEYHFCARPK